MIEEELVKLARGRGGNLRERRTEVMCKLGRAEAGVSPKVLREACLGSVGDRDANMMLTSYL